MKSSNIAGLSLANMWVSFIFFSVAALLGLYQVIERIDLIPGLKSPELYFASVSTHGVLMGFVLTTFFIVGFGYYTATTSLKQEVWSKPLGWFGFFVSLTGVLMAAVPLLTGNASVLYTFYPPLMAHPAFYIGATLLVVGSWAWCLQMVVMMAKWKKANPGETVPLAMFGTTANAILWFITSLGAASELLFQLIPWSLGIIDTVPPDSQLYISLGNIMMLQDRYEDSVVYYEKGRALNPNSASVYSALGGAFVKLGRLEEAEDYLLRAKETNPQLRELHFNLALLREEQQNLSQAAEDYRLELEINPYNFRASFNLSRIYRFLKDDREEEKHLEKTIEINPNFPLSYFYLARIYLNRGEMYPEAISLTEKGIELNPPKHDLPLGYFLLADLYNRVGQSAKSQEYLEKGKALVQENSKKEE